MHHYVIIVYVLIIIYHELLNTEYLFLLITYILFNTYYLFDISNYWGCIVYGLFIIYYVLYIYYVLFIHLYLLFIYIYYSLLTIIQCWLIIYYFYNKYILFTRGLTKRPILNSKTDSSLGAYSKKITFSNFRNIENLYSVNLNSN